jgi:uncharacterized iron-regulated membrane protein
VLTGFLMWWKRRPAGGTGLPGPASDATRAATPKNVVKVVSVAAVALGVLYPAFGVSLLVVLGVEAVLAVRRRADAEEVEPVRADDGGEDVPVGALQ